MGTYAAAAVKTTDLARTDEEPQVLDPKDSHAAAQMNAKAIVAQVSGEIKKNIDVSVQKVVDNASKMLMKKHAKQATMGVMDVDQALYMLKKTEAEHDKRMKGTKGSDPKQ